MFYCLVAALPLKKFAEWSIYPTPWGKPAQGMGHTIRTIFSDVYEIYTSKNY